MIFWTAVTVIYGYLRKSGSFTFDDMNSSSGNCTISHNRQGLWRSSSWVNGTKCAGWSE